MKGSIVSKAHQIIIGMSLTMVLFAGVYGTAGAAGETTLSPGPRYLGGLDLWEYCAERYGGELILRNRWWGAGPYDWRCRVSTISRDVSVSVGQRRSVDVGVSAGRAYTDYQFSFDAVCEAQHGRGAYAMLINDPHSPNSWRCFRK